LTTHSSKPEVEGNRLIGNIHLHLPANGNWNKETACTHNFTDTVRNLSHSFLCCMPTEHFEVALHKNRSSTCGAKVLGTEVQGSTYVFVPISKFISTSLLFPLQEPTTTERMPFTTCNNKP